MEKDIKALNKYFRAITKSDVDFILSSIILSERQETIFTMFYIKKHDIGFIADTLNVCRRVINRELMAIRDKIYPLI